eukprot:gnl/TRDRNA2_/TRDRNA2_165214_c0_seq2.p1 gnl/TRDRNA2_/TRDRNA2_165214_c0~~gnl/TRDRNA2_/TRDRNA2_165214_c0_seq2.p1  ORF type:complete len:166 (+),score=14.53 gnl/TRDRNA2_/TRDRNA2_165214_c0_seq2:258-755(+)
MGGRQDLHSDIKRPGEHLELHVPLRDGGGLPLTMGPTRFCQCLRSNPASPNPFDRAVRWYFGDKQACLEYEELSWTFHADSGAGAGPWATLYDADLSHQGLENISPEDRPVFVVALAASPIAVRERGYCDDRSISTEHLVAMNRFRGANVTAALAQSADAVLASL